MNIESSPDPNRATFTRPSAGGTKSVDVGNHTRGLASTRSIPQFPMHNNQTGQIPIPRSCMGQCHYSYYGIPRRYRAYYGMPRCYYPYCYMPPSYGSQSELPQKQVPQEHVPQGKGTQDQQCYYSYSQTDGTRIHGGNQGDGYVSPEGSDKVREKGDEAARELGN
jgi:hypothetical protein